MVMKMATVTMTLEEYNALIKQLQEMSSENISRVLDEAPKKRKRRASKYNRNFAKAYRKIKKAKPRTKHANIMKQAHKMAKRMK